MLRNTVRTRAVSFAFVFGPPRFVNREEATRVHNGVCDALGHDDLTFRYNPGDSPGRGSPNGFSIVIGRQEGRGGFEITTDFVPPKLPGLRLLVHYQFPPSLEHVHEVADSASTAVFDALEGTWQKVMAEVRLRAECDVVGNNAVAFVRDQLCRFDPTQLNALGEPLAFCGVALGIGERPHGGEALAYPKRDVRIEVLRDDSRLVYIETVNQWKQLPETQNGTINLTELGTTIRPFDERPSDYIRDSHNYLTECVLKLGTKA